MGAMFFCKKWTFPSQNETKLILDLNFFSLHFTYLGGGCVHTQRTIPAYGPEAFSELAPVLRRRGGVTQLSVTL